jgi:hypothetical protein
LAASARDGLTHCALIDVGFEAQPTTTSAAAIGTTRATLRACMEILPDRLPVVWWTVRSGSAAGFEVGA